MKGGTSMENKFIRVDEVADELGVSRPYAYIVPSEAQHFQQLLTTFAGSHILHPPSISTLLCR